MKRNKVDTKPQAQSNFDVTSFQSQQILDDFIMGTKQNFIVGTDQWTDGVSYRGATLRLTRLIPNPRRKAIST
jgi:hypothetical protein